MKITLPSNHSEHGRICYAERDLHRVHPCLSGPVSGGVQQGTIVVAYRRPAASPPRDRKHPPQRAGPRERTKARDG